MRYTRGKLETLEEPRIDFGTADDAQKSSRYRTSRAQRAPCYQIPAIRSAINCQARMLQISLTPRASTPGYLDVVAPRLCARHYEMNGQVQLGIHIPFEHKRQTEDEELRGSSAQSRSMDQPGRTRAAKRTD